MSRKLQDDSLAAFKQLATRLKTNRIIFLIKTEDHYFDDFFLRLLSENILLSSPQKINNAINPQSEQVQLVGGSDITFVEIPRMTSEVMEDLCKRVFQKVENTTPKEIYLLPAHLVHTSLKFPCKESIFSSSIFLSEQVHVFAFPALEEGLEQVFETKISPAIISFYTNQWILKKSSFSKLLFFASTFKQDIEKLITQDIENREEFYSYDLFLDNKGTEFLSSFGFEIPLESIQTFFRSFIHVDGTVAHLVELSYEELSSYSKLSKENLDKLLEVATSSNFQLLSKRDGAYRLSIPEYVTEWQELKNWVSNEQKAFKQFKIFEEIALEYFKGTGLLLGKDRLEQALVLKEEIFTTYAWEKKYNVDEELFSSFLLLSQNHQDEFIKTQLKKRASLLKNSIRISIAVSIAFLLSSFTALLAYLERNSAIIQQELAIKSKEEAEQATDVAERERLEAIKARKDEQSALKVAEKERIDALNARDEAKVQRKNAIENLILAKKSEQEASAAKEVAQQNEKLAKEATITAQINFETSERLRNQQEARATALEALGYFANENYLEGVELVKSAYKKNLLNDGFPLQSDIFNALLNGMNTAKAKESELSLEFPAKLLALSPGKEKLAVYTINGEVQIFSTQPKISFESSIKTGYIKSFEFLSATQLLGTDLLGKLFFIDLTSNTFSTINPLLPIASSKGLFKVVGRDGLWIAHLANDDRLLYHFNAEKGFTEFNLTETNSPVTNTDKSLYWFEGKNFYEANLLDLKPEVVVTTSSNIQSVAWSTIHKLWMLGLENGQIWSVDPKKARPIETFAIHATKVSQLISMPYAHGTELLLSTGYDGGLTILVFDKTIPISASVSSRIKFQGHRSWITGFSVDEKKKIAYSIGNDRTLKVWPLEIDKFLNN